MADILLEKNVSFLGSWKANRLSDHLLHEITAHGKDNKGASSILQVLPQGIRLIVNGDPQKSGLIQEKNVLEIKQNRLQLNSMLCVVKDDSSLLLNILVWGCDSENDVFDILKCFSGTHNNNNNNLVNGQSLMVNKTETRSRGYSGNDNVVMNGDISVETHRYRKKGQGRSVVTTTLSQTVTNNANEQIEGQRDDTDNKVKVIDFHSNVQQKEDLDQIKVVHVPRGSMSSQTQEDEVFSHTRSVNFAEHNNITYPPVRDAIVQTDLQDTDTDSLAASASSSLKDEICSLQQEVKELRLIVESSVVISNAEYFRRKQLSDSLNSNSSNPKFLHVQGGHDQYDSRSFASQTDTTKLVNRQTLSHDQARQKMMFVRRSRVQSEPRYLRHSQPAMSAQIPTRSQRYQSDSAVYSNHGYRLVPRQHLRSSSSSSTSGSLNKKMMRYVTLPPDGRMKKEGKQSWRNYQRKSGLFLNSTVERPIEDVYAGQRKSRKRMEQSQRRSRQIITPQTFAVNSNGGHMGNGIASDHDDYQKISDMKRQHTNLPVSNYTEEKPKEPEMDLLKVPEVVHHNVQVEPQAT